MRDLKPKWPKHFEEIESHKVVVREIRIATFYDLKENSEIPNLCILTRHKEEYVQFAINAKIQLVQKMYKFKSGNFFNHYPS